MSAVQTPSSTLAYTPINTPFGAELEKGVRLLDFDDAQLEALQQLAAERGVVVVRDQAVGVREHRQAIGDPENRPARVADG